MIFSCYFKNNANPESEDCRTSTVLGTALCLPDKVLESLFKACLTSKDTRIDGDWGRLEDYKFWPSWDAEGTENKSRVEPDVWLRFTEIDVIVEVKRNDSEGQNHKQWKNEIKAFHNSFPEYSKLLLFIALGGNTGIDGCYLGEEVLLCQLTWLRFRQVVDNMLALESLECERVLRQIQMACDYYGFRSYSWLDSKPFVETLRVDTKILYEVYEQRGFK